MQRHSQSLGMSVCMLLSCCFSSFSSSFFSFCSYSCCNSDHDVSLDVSTTESTTEDSMRKLCMIFCWRLTKNCVRAQRRVLWPRLSSCRFSVVFFGFLFFSSRRKCSAENILSHHVQGLLCVWSSFSHSPWVTLLEGLTVLQTLEALTLQRTGGLFSSLWAQWLDSLKAIFDTPCMSIVFCEQTLTLSSWIASQQLKKKRQEQAHKNGYDCKSPE